MDSLTHHKSDPEKEASNLLSTIRNNKNERRKIKAFLTLLDKAYDYDYSKSLIYREALTSLMFKISSLYFEGKEEPWMPRALQQKLLELEKQKLENFDLKDKHREFLHSTFLRKTNSKGCRRSNSLKI